MSHLPRHLPPLHAVPTILLNLFILSTKSLYGVHHQPIKRFGFPSLKTPALSFCCPSKIRDSRPQDLLKGTQTASWWLLRGHTRHRTAYSRTEGREDIPAHCEGRCRKRTTIKKFIVVPLNISPWSSAIGGYRW